jgi:hypothetical protein
VRHRQTNDQNAYLAMEDAVAALSKAADGGDAAAGAKASTEISTTVASYLVG